MKPRDISGRILRRPLSSPFAPRAFRPRLGWLLIAALAWGLWAGLLSDRSFLRIAQLRRELGAAGRELSRVQSEQRQIEVRLDDPGARTLHAEQLLREEHGMARPGEIIYRFRDDPRARDSLARR